jgi:hypothetical protein
MTALSESELREPDSHYQACAAKKEAAHAQVKTPSTNNETSYKAILYRIEKEYNELNEKIGKLNVVFDLTRADQFNISDEQMNYMHEQLIHMINYRKVLRDRFFSLLKQEELQNRFVG